MESWGGNDTIIEEGAVVRERQVIVRLPDSERMQVKAKINESKVALVAEGQPATIHLDAFPDIELHGAVKKVNEYPAQSAWWAGNIKEYDTLVEIRDLPVTLRPGLTAEVKIRVARQLDVLQAPVQSILEHGGKHYCAVKKGPDWETRELQIGLTNDKFVVVQEGLEEREQLALAVASLRGKLDLPELPAEIQKLGSTAARGGMGPSGEVGGKQSSEVAKKADLAEAPNRMFRELDKNHDGKLDIKEVPESFRSRFAEADTNKDGYLDQKEWAAAQKRAKPAASEGQAGKGPSS